MTDPKRAPASLARSITLALVVKAAILYLIWSAFFSHPQTSKMRLPAGQVEQHFLAAPPVNPTLPTKAHDDPH